MYFVSHSHYTCFVPVPITHALFSHSHYMCFMSHSHYMCFMSHSHSTCLCAINCISSDIFVFAGAILLAQWMNPWSGVSSESILGELDDIAVQVARKILAKQMSGGSICPPPTLSSSELMSRVQCLGLGTCAVLDELNAVLYGPLGFRPSSQEEYYDDSNSYIDQVTGMCVVECCV